MKVICASKYKNIFKSVKFLPSAFAFLPLSRGMIVHCLNIFTWCQCVRWGLVGVCIYIPHTLKYVLPLYTLFFNLLIYIYIYNGCVLFCDVYMLSFI